MWLNTNGSEITTTTKYTVSVREGNNTIILQNGTVVPSIILNITIHSLSSADGGNYTCRGLRGESVTQLVIVEGTAPPTTPPPPTTRPLTTERTLAPTCNNVLLPTVHGLVSIVTILVISLFLLIIFIVYLLRKINKINKSLIRSTEAVQVRTSLSVQEKEDTSLSVKDVTYEEIAERSNMLLTKNDAYVCVSTPLEK